MDKDVAWNTSCAEGLAEIIELLLIHLQDSADIFLDVQIRSTADHLDDDMIFLVKVTSNRHFCIETFFTKYGNHLQKFSSLIIKMQTMETESHINLSFSENGERVRKSYFLESENGHYRLKSTKHKSKPGTNSTDTVLHIRMFQNKHMMMLQGKKLYHHLKQISLCSKVSLGLSLTVQENDCHFDIRPCREDFPTAIFPVSTNTEYLLSETQYNPLPVLGKTVSSTAEELAIIPDLSNVTFQLVTVGLKTICKIQPDTPSLVMLSWYGPGNIPLFDTADTKSEMETLSFVDWEKYGMTIPLENSKQCKGHQPCHESVSLISLRGACCFVLTLYVYLNITSQENAEKKIDALSWLRKYKHKWMDTYKEKIEESLESVLEQTLKPQRTTEEDRISLQYSQAIASISKSISNVVLRSPCEQFRRKCSQLLETDDNGSVQQAVSRKLWSITESMGIYRPADVLETVGPTLEKNQNVEQEGQSELQNFENETAGGHKMHFHEDELEGLDWLQQPKKANLDNSTETCRKTHVLNFIDNILEESNSACTMFASQEASSHTVDGQNSKANCNYKINEERENMQEQELEYPENTLIIQSVESNVFTCLNTGYNKKHSSVEEEDHFQTIMEAEDILNSKEMGFGTTHGKESNCELSELEEIEHVQDFNETNDKEEDLEPPRRTNSLLHESFHSENSVGSTATETSKTGEKVDAWLDEALLEMRDWFSDE